MAKYQRIVTTKDGLELLAKAVAGGTVTFTSIKTGSGTYTGTEDLSTVTDLKSVRQTFGVSSITRTGTQVKLRSVLNNDNLTEGYSMTEIGLYAKNPDTGSDILYAIIVAELADYLPPYETAPASITLELYIELTEAENDVIFMAEVIAGTYVPVESFNEHVASEIHITAAERTAWNAKLGTTGNASDTTAAFTEATTLAALTSGSKLSALFGAIAKAVSSLISHLVNTNNPHSVTKAQVDLGNVDNTSDANKPISTATQAELNKKALAADLTGHTGSRNNPHGVTAAQAGAVPASETNIFNFTNKSLNTVNIDEVFDYNYVTAISEEGYGTVPSSGWLNIINFYSSHFVTQIACTCTTGMDNNRRLKMWVRERYISQTSGWSGWKLIHNSNTITYGTTDLAAGTSPLGTGEIYLVYE